MGSLSMILSATAGDRRKIPSPKQRAFDPDPVLLIKGLIQIIHGPQPFLQFSGGPGFIASEGPSAIRGPDA